MHVIKTFSHGLPEIAERASLPTFYTCLAKASKHVQATQGTPFDCLTQVAKRASITELHGIITIQKIVIGRLPPPKHCTNSILKYNPSLPMKSAY